MKIARLTRGEGRKGGPGCWMTVLSQYVADGEWTDQLDCVDPLVNQLCVTANDLLPTDESRAELIGPRLFDPIGTRGTVDDTARRLLVVADWTMRQFAEKWAALHGRPGYFGTMPPIDSLEALELARNRPVLASTREHLRTLSGDDLTLYDYALGPVVNVLDWSYTLYTGWSHEGFAFNQPSDSASAYASTNIVAAETARMACIAYGADPTPRATEKDWLSANARIAALTMGLLPLIDEVIQTGPRGGIELPAAERRVRETCPANF